MIKHLSMKEKMTVKHKTLSRKELVRIFAGMGIPDPPPVHNDPGTGADSPISNRNDQLNSYTKNYYANCMLSGLSNSDYCWKSALHSM